MTDSDRADFYGSLAVGKDAQLRVFKSKQQQYLLFEIGDGLNIYIDDVETLDRLVGILEQSKAAFGPDAPEYFSREFPVDWFMQSRAEREDHERDAAKVIAA